MTLGEEKKDRKIVTTGQKYNGPLLHRVAIRRKKPQDKNIMVCPIP